MAAVLCFFIYYHIKHLHFAFLSANLRTFRVTESTGLNLSCFISHMTLPGEWGTKSPIKLFHSAQHRSYHWQIWHFKGCVLFSVPLYLLVTLILTWLRQIWSDYSILIHNNYNHHGVTSVYFSHIFSWPKWWKLQLCMGLHDYSQVLSTLEIHIKALILG